MEATTIESAARKAVLTSKLATDTTAIDVNVDAMTILSNESTSSSWCHCPDVVSIKATTCATAHSRVKFLH